jgi:hypothetical protein
MVLSIIISTYLFLINNRKIPNSNKPSEVKVTKLYEIDDNFKQKQKPFEELSLTPTFKVKGSLPEKVDTFRYKKIPISDKTINSIFNYYKIKPEPENIITTEEGTIYIAYNTDGLFVNIYKDMGYINISYPDNNMFSSIEEAGGITESPEYFQEKVADTLQALGFDISQFEFVEYAYLSEGYEPEVINNPKEAHGITIIYDAKINGLSLSDMNGLSKNQAIFTFTANGNISKISLSTVGEVGERLSTVSIKSRNEIMNEIMNRKISLIETYFYDVDIASIANVSVKSVELVYFYKDEAIYPI